MNLPSYANQNAVKSVPYAQNVNGSYTDGIDPRETGNLIARLQVATELISSLRQRLTNLADRIHQDGSPINSQNDVHMNLLRFPDELIADARVMDSQIDRIEGALGV